MKAWDGNPLRVPWRVGRKVGRTIYACPFDPPSDSDPLIGLMDTPELAEYAVRAHNDEIDAKGDIDRFDAHVALPEAQEHLERVEEERDRLRAALFEISVGQGKVCSHYEICEHEACASSYASWAIAHAAVSPPAEDLAY